MAARERLICRSNVLLDGGAGCRFEIQVGPTHVPAFVVRFRGSIFAYVNECRHVPSQLDWMPGEFFDASKLYLICATHGALYKPDTGMCVAGPCRGARLVRLEVIERDGWVIHLYTD